MRRQIAKLNPGPDVPGVAHIERLSKGTDTVGELRRARNFTPYTASSNIESLEDPVQKGRA
jgi:hypothetical protein